MNVWPWAKSCLKLLKQTGHRLAPHVDDSGVGQEQMNEADVAEVVRHLVDEARPPGGAIGACIAQVLLPEPAEVHRGHAKQCLRIARRIGRRAAAL